MTVVLVLSGGGLWSAAGIGVAEALNDLGISVDGVVGSSAGSLVGALIALGYAPRELRQLTERLRPQDFSVSWTLWARALLRGTLPEAALPDTPLWQRLNPYFEGKHWQSLARPLWVVTSSLTHRMPVIYGSSPPMRSELGHRMHLAWAGEQLELPLAIRASMAVPGIFPPVLSTNGVLVDGGVVDDFPVDVAAWVGADRIIGVWVDEPDRWRLPSRWHAGHIAASSLTTMIRELTTVRQRQIAVPQVTIRLEMDAGHRVFHRVADIIRRGYEEAMAQRDLLQALFDPGG